MDTQVLTYPVLNVGTQTLKWTQNSNDKKTFSLDLGQAYAMIAPTAWNYNDNLPPGGHSPWKEVWGCEALKTPFHALSAVP